MQSLNRWVILMLDCDKKLLEMERKIGAELTNVTHNPSHCRPQDPQQDETLDRVDIICGVTWIPEFSFAVLSDALFIKLPLRKRITLKIARIINWLSNKIGDKNE